MSERQEKITTTSPEELERLRLEAAIKTFAFKLLIKGGSKIGEAASEINCDLEKSVRIIKKSYPNSSAEEILKMIDVSEIEEAEV